MNQSTHMAYDKLIKEMRSRGWSQKQLAELSKVHENTITRLVHYQNIQLDTLELIAGALGYEFKVIKVRRKKVK